MKTMTELKRYCKMIVSAQVNHGKEICDEFRPSQGSTYFCDNCGYTHFVHLAKDVSETLDSIPYSEVIFGSDEYVKQNKAGE